MYPAEGPLDLFREAFAYGVRRLRLLQLPEDRAGISKSGLLFKYPAK
jgi:hypothetical protein